MSNNFASSCFDKHGSSESKLDDYDMDINYVPPTKVSREDSEEINQSATRSF